MADQLYRDPHASVAERVADLLDRMTLVEKAAQLGAVWITELVEDEAFSEERARARLRDGIGQVTRIGASTGLVPEGSAALMNAIQRVALDHTRLGIPVLVHEEAVAGFCARGATTFPQALGLAAGFDPTMVESVAGVIRAQMRAVGARLTLSPVLDIARDPRWGRVEETYGESVELASRLGVAYVRGLQTDDLVDGVACTGKHFLGYGASIGGRNQAPVHLGPRELRAVYAAPFAAAISEAGLAAIMNSYSSVDGLPCAGSSQILTELLRDELGFDGVVVADYFAVVQLAVNHHTASDKADAARQALSAGLDVELPALDCFRELPALVADGALDEALVDRAVGRHLSLKLRLGLFEDPYAPGGPITVYDTDEDRRIAFEAARSALCLLTNDGVLPLDAGALDRLAVIGPAADDRRLLQGDYHYPAHLEIMDVGRATSDPEAGPDAGIDQLPSAGGTFRPGPYYTEHVTPLAALRDGLGDAVQVDFARGCDDADPFDEDIDAAVELAALSDVAVVFVGARSGLTPDATVGEARDVVSLDLPGAQRALVEAVAATGTPTVVVVISGRVHTLSDEAEVASALCWTAPPGEEGGRAIADALFGLTDCRGRLPVTLPRHVGQVPIHHDVLARGDRSEFYGDYVDAPATPLFAFGHGLSYAVFEYGEVRAHSGSTSTPTTIELEVTNRSAVAGREVVQCYARDDVASVARPVAELVGFVVLDLEPERSATVRFTIHPSRLAHVGPDMRLVCEPGRFTIWCASSSAPSAARRTEAVVELDGTETEYDQRTIVATTVEISP